jgi:catechol 2,3-dioxygenase-like lactoylglutathione lyase family enzyme
MARITGVQHIAVAVNDMREALKLYRDILGMTIQSAKGMPVGAEAPTLIAEMPVMPSRLYNLDVGNGTVLTLAEVRDASIAGRKSGFAVDLWPGTYNASAIGGIDHIGFNVETDADLVALHNELGAAGYEVSEIQRLDVNPWWKQFFFYDRDGNAWEVTTWDWSDPAWEARKAEMEKEGGSMLFRDEDPAW